MKLEALRPTSGADLQQLHHAFQEQGWHAALPSSLPEQLLLGLVRDLRVLEANAGRDHAMTDLSGPLFAAIFLMVENPLRGAMRGSKLQVSDAAVDHAVRVYQLTLEREIVRRITGFAAGSETEQLLAALERIANG